MDARFTHNTQSAHPYDVMIRWAQPVRLWWADHFAQLTAPQALALPAIQDGRNVLVTAPTGSGKTLCAFTTVLSELFSQRQNGTLADGIQAVYISPLRALGADIARNLNAPLTQIAALMNLPDTAGIRIGVRSGDTTSHQRRKMSLVPPHILVTTPESLALCLAQERMRRHLQSVKVIITDELHALAGNKRGVDLAVSIERLSRLAFVATGKDPQRIGLSATIAPLEGMAGFLVGSAHAGRTCVICDATFNRPIDLDIAAPFGKTPFCTTAAINKRVYDELEDIIRHNRTTLVFTNTRSATERVTFALRDRFSAGFTGALPPAGAAGPDLLVRADQIEAHHSSVDPEKRREIEQRLKNGELRCVVSSTSLELGIDIGTIDRVVLLNSPKGVARGLQRVGRAGHWHGGTARGTFMPTVPVDLIESIVTADAMRRRHLDDITVPENCLDVLAQQLIGMTIEAGATGLKIDEAYHLLRQTFPYAALSQTDFDDTIAFITQRPLPSPDGVAPEPPRIPARSKMRCENGRLFSPSLGAAALYAQNIGTITTDGHIKVMQIDGGGCIGTIEESFAALLKPGDRFVLGGKCVELVNARHMAVDVTPAKGKLPTVPRWFSGTMAMGQGLCHAMQDFRHKAKNAAPAGVGAIKSMLLRQWRVSESIAAVAAEYLHAQHRYAEIPTDDMLLIERVPDEDSLALIFHTLLGRAANEAVARAVAYRFNRNFGGNAAVVIDDYACGVWLPPSATVRRADRTLMRTLLSPDRFEQDVAAAVETSELFRAQFRYTAVRAHALMKNRFGKQQFIGVIQAYATRLFEALCQQAPDHLLLRETRRTVLHDVLNTPVAAEYLQRAQNIPLRIVDLPSPSPFSFGLFATGRRDTMQLADTSDFLLAMYKKVQQQITANKKEEARETMLF